MSNLLLQNIVLLRVTEGGKIILKKKRPLLLARSVPKELKQVTTTGVWFGPGGSDIRKFDPWFCLANTVPV